MANKMAQALEQAKSDSYKPQGLKKYQAISKAQAKKREEVGNDVSHKGAVRGEINDALNKFEKSKKAVRDNN